MFNVSFSISESTSPESEVTGFDFGMMELSILLRLRLLVVEVGIEL